MILVLDNAPYHRVIAQELAKKKGDIVGYLRMHGCKQLKVERHDGRTMYYEVADDRLKGKDKQFIWNMGYLKAAEFRWFK